MGSAPAEEFAETVVCEVRVLYNTTENFDRFKRMFRMVWKALPPDCATAIAKKLRELRFTDGFIVEDEHGVVLGRAWETGVVEIASMACVSDEATGYILAHEFRHLWQFSTNFMAGEPNSDQLEKITTRWLWLSLEADSDTFAKRCGFPKPGIEAELSAHLLPYDKTFRSLAKSWAYMTRDERLELTAQAMGIRLRELSKLD